MSLTYGQLTHSKQRANKLAGVYQRHGEAKDLEWMKKRAYRVGNCSVVWTGTYCTCCGKVERFHSFGCGDRLCPICSIRKARATAAQALQVVPHLHGVPFLITLTQRNVGGMELGECLDRMSDAWHMVMMRRSIKRGFLSWAKTTEITYNRERMDFHPHVHIIAYFNENETDLNTKEFWQRQWADVMGLEYIPDVDVRPIDEEAKAVAEVSKYLTKVGVILDMKDPHLSRAVVSIAKAVRSRRLRGYGGEWRKVRKQLCLRDPDSMTDVELNEAGDQLEESSVCCGREMISVVMRWAYDHYEIASTEGSTNGQGEIAGN